jgi:hypothetical protein
LLILQAAVSTRAQNLNKSLRIEFLPFEKKSNFKTKLFATNFKEQKEGKQNCGLFF